MMKSHLLYLLLSVSCLIAVATVRAQDNPVPTEGGKRNDAPPASGAEGTAAEDGAEPDAEEDEDRVTFSFTLSGEQGGGQATGSAGDFEYQEGQYLIATGGVDFKYQGLRLQAERARIDIPTNLLTAEGDVILDEGPQRLAGQTLEYDLDTRTGRVTEATAYAEGDYYFTGSEIAKTGDITYTVENGMFTACEQDVPSWSLHMSEGRVTLEEYVRLKNARLKFKKLPVLYAPYLVWPANTERSSGLLVPKPGFSSRRGAELSMAYFKTLGRSADTTFLLDLSSDEYFGFGNETRYRPSERTTGYFRAYVLSEPNVIDPEFFDNFTEDLAAGETRWKAELLHETRDIWGGFRGVVSLREYSDLDYLQDYERNTNRQRQPYVYSNAFLSRNFGPHSLNIMVDQRERILAQGNRDLRRQLPEVEYKLRKLRLGNSWAYLDLQSSLNYFSLELEGPFTSIDPETDLPVTETVRLSEQYGRVDVSPTLTVSLSSLNWLSADVELGGRATFYTDSLTPTDEVPDGEPRGFSGEDLSRAFPRAAFEIVGPSFLRIFDKKIGRFAKFKHIVEPRVDYAFVGDFDEQSEIFRFDEIDNLRPLNGFLFSLVNRLVAKPADEDQGGAIEIASLTFSQGLSNDRDQPGQVSRFDSEARPIRTSEGPFGVALRINPSRATSFTVEAGFNTLFDQFDIETFRLSGSTKIGRHHFGVSWFSGWRIELAESPTDILPVESIPVLSTKTSDQAQFSTRLELLPDRLSLEAQLSFDILGPTNDDGGRDAWDLQTQRYFLNWKAQCYSWQLEYRESNYRTIEDRDVRFSLTLKNVGTFLDLNDSF